MNEPQRREQQLADSVERRTMTEGNSGKLSVTAAQKAESTLNGLDRVRQAVRRDRSMRLTTLLHHITPSLLREAYHKLNRQAAVGVDGVTWQAYGKGLSEKLKQLHERIHTERYRTTPSKRIWIPKPDGHQRPIGIASLEDKTVQQAITWVLEAIYEEEFKGFSYGFRPGRHAHMALDAIHVAIMQKKVSWILDADISGFFDSISHNWMMKFLEHRIADERILRLIAKFLRAGVSEEGEWSKTEAGTPQGAVISPIMANIYLHYVLDLWVDNWRRKHARGEVYIVRYADDFVMGFQYRSDAEQMSAALRERMNKFSLNLHPEKTRLIEFGRFAQSNRQARGESKPESFDFLGFTHRCARRRSDGGFKVRRETIKKRQRRKLHDIKRGIRMRMHHPIHQTGRWLRSVMTGYLNYYSVPGNLVLMNAFRAEICRAWYRTLRRRSQKGSALCWDRCKRLIMTWIPSVRVRHPYPNQRLVV